MKIQPFNSQTSFNGRMDKSVEIALRDSYQRIARSDLKWHSNNQTFKNIWQAKYLPKFKDTLKKMEELALSTHHSTTIYAESSHNKENDKMGLGINGVSQYEFYAKNSIVPNIKFVFADFIQDTNGCCKLRETAGYNPNYFDSFLGATEMLNIYGESKIALLNNNFQKKPGEYKERFDKALQLYQQGSAQNCYQYKITNEILNEYESKYNKYHNISD